MNVCGHVAVPVAGGCGLWLLLWLWLWLWPVGGGGGGGVYVCVCVLKLLWTLEVATVRVCLIMVCIGGFWAWVSLFVAFVSCLFLCVGVCVRVRMCVFRV